MLRAEVELRTVGIFVWRGRKDCLLDHEVGYSYSLEVVCLYPSVRVTKFCYEECIQTLFTNEQRYYMMIETQ